LWRLEIKRTAPPPIPPDTLEGPVNSNEKIKLGQQKLLATP
jgi:hypothetical protein